VSSPAATAADVRTFGRRPPRDIILAVKLVTETLASDPDRTRGREEWALCVALDCARLEAAPARVGLAGVAEVEIGRGDRRAFRRHGGRVRLDLEDGGASKLHAVLARGATGWSIADSGSKNGTLVNGKRVERAELADGDVVECGGTFLVLRRGPGPIRDLEAPAGTGPLGTISPALERELALLPKIARSVVPVLISGESGTGKEIVAAAIHELSGRRGPLVAVNCGALPATLVESELFGSRRGAFSGAEDRAGLVRGADGGTLFLDEIAELPGASQAALLRMLQGGEVLPLGAGKAVRVDVRVLAATNRRIEELVAAARFRRDLYARLRGYEVRMPALHARLEDLGLLVAALLARLDPDRPHRLARAAARALFLHGWPLQVRELEQVLRAALAVSAGPEIAVKDLMLREGPPAEPSVAAIDGRRQLLALLEKHAHNVSAVARDLGTSRSQVKRLLARHGL
jgi:transcriptional regulator of acetoin/glycerol metabolism